MSDEEIERGLADVLANRRSKFAAKLEPARYPECPGDMVLSITHNGYQWQSVSLLPDEMKAVLKLLNEHLDRK